MYLFVVEVIIQIGAQFEFLDVRLREVDEEARAHILLHVAAIRCWSYKREVI